MALQQTPRTRHGTLILVVGPSGAGKDSVLDGARAALAHDAQFIFARRTITRPASAGGENHIEATPDDFLALQKTDAFCLTWQAHGLRYGIDRSCIDDIASGNCVIANVSRSVIDSARRRFPSIRIINITAPADILARRLALRGRETAEDIRRRLERATDDVPGGPDVITLHNAGTVAESARTFVQIMRLSLLEAG